MSSWSEDWRIWLVGILIALLLLWIFIGRKSEPQEFKGLQFLEPCRAPIDTSLSVSTFVSEDKGLPMTPHEPLIVQAGAPVSYLEEPEVQKPMTIQYIPIFSPKKEPVVTKPRKYGSKGEQICCETMEKIYGVPFTSVRPDWLKNPETGANLEIDCYNDELKLGVEYNGIQHYVFPNIYHRNNKDFINQVRRDQYKLEMCDKNGVYLITVPHNVPHNKIEEYIKSHLPEQVCHSY